MAVHTAYDSSLSALANRFIRVGGPIRQSIHTQTSTFYDAVATPYTNLLRATTEAMAAVIGGCDALTVHPYNTVSDQACRTGLSVTVLPETYRYC